MVLVIILDIGSWGGGITLMAGPNGEILPRLVPALAGSAFPAYFAPGAILLAILGLGPLAAAILARRRHPLAPFLMFAAAEHRSSGSSCRSQSSAIRTIRLCRPRAFYSTSS